MYLNVIPLLLCDDVHHLPPMKVLVMIDQLRGFWYENSRSGWSMLLKRRLSPHKQQDDVHSYDMRG